MLVFKEEFPTNDNLWVIKECPKNTFTALFCGDPQSDSWEFICNVDDKELKGFNLKKLKIALASNPGFKVDFYIKSNIVKIVDVFDNNGRLLDHESLVAWCSENGLKLTKIIDLVYSPELPDIKNNTVIALHG